MADNDPLIPRVKYATFDTLGDGSTTSWEFNFAGGYISRDHVKAFTEDLVTGELRIISPLVFTGPNTVNIVPAVPTGMRLVIYRDTPKTEPLVDYTEGSIINERNLDVSNQQAVFIAAELADRVVADYDFSNALLYAVTTATAAAATANGIDAKATTALANSVAAVTASAAATATAGTALTVANTGTVAAPRVSYTSPANVVYTLKEQLDVLYYGAVSIRDKRFAGGAKGDGVTDDTAAVQACLDYCLTSGSTMLIPAGVHMISSTLNKAASFQCPNIRGAGGDRAVLRYTGPAGTPCLKIIGGSGYSVNAVCSDVGFDGTTTNYAVVIADQNLFQLLNCQFFRHRIGVIFHNVSGFTEYCKARQCVFSEACEQAIVYRKTVATGGHDSFHGTGLVDCLLVETAGATRPKIEIGGELSDDQRILVYNTEMSFQVWKNSANCPVIRNNSEFTTTNFHGQITVEDFTNGPFNLAEGSGINWVGLNINELKQTMQLGTVTRWETYGTDLGGNPYGLRSPFSSKIIAVPGARVVIPLVPLAFLSGETYDIVVRVYSMTREFQITQRFTVSTVTGNAASMLKSPLVTLYNYFGGQAAFPVDADYSLVGGSGVLALNTPAGWTTDMRVVVQVLPITPTFRYKLGE